MYYKNYYQSPIGKIFLIAEDNFLIDLYFEAQKYFPQEIFDQIEKKNLEIFDVTKKWLDIYFNGYEPDFLPPLKMIGTYFQIEVWKLLLKIPYGKITTYGELSKVIADQRNLQRFSAQAIGDAVGKNKISIIIPCHRVIGSDGSLTGYAGGIDKKSRLLNLEKCLID
ncbi:MAG: methylated-DNA--[Selenomonadaceae bacterium]|nr:methylated-DNA--[protein]-cysteine S-methyltransferase [Selenomonadaceae bacterium]